MRQKKQQEIQKKTEQYYFFRLPKEDFEFLDNLQIAKTSFIKQACLFFIENIKKTGQGNLYFRNDTTTKNKPNDGREF